MKKFDFSIEINTPAENVWNMMLGAETYKIWTAPFSPGSFYKGSWEKGSKILFLSGESVDGTEGMVSEIAESRPYEFVSIRHLGFVKGGVEDTTSPEVTAWAPSYENYTFTEKDGTTKVDIDVEMDEKYDSMMNEMWPKALAKLKEISEK